MISCACAALLVSWAPAEADQRVFLSSTSSMGDLGGLEGADATCQQLADAEGLGGRWVAWLSTADVAAINRILGDGPFRLINGDVVFANRAELTSGSLRNEIDRTEADVQVPASVWTGTDADGSAADSGNYFCDAWTDSTNGSFGQTGFSQSIDANWTNANQIFCNLEARLYCFEQGAAAGAPVLSWIALATLTILLLLAGAWRVRGSQRLA